MIIMTASFLAILPATSPLFFLVGRGIVLLNSTGRIVTIGCFPPSRASAQVFLGLIVGMMIRLDR